jgi:hypothetical protein
MAIQPDPQGGPQLANIRATGLRTVVAQEVADRVVARRAAGESMSAITGSLHLTPREVRAVLDVGQVASRRSGLEVSTGEMAASISGAHDGGTCLLRTGSRPAPLGLDTVAVIVRRRENGELAADIGRDYGLTPLGVLDLLREVRNGEWAVPAAVVEMAERAVSLRRRSHGGDVR